MGKHDEGDGFFTEGNSISETARMVAFSASAARTVGHSHKTHDETGTSGLTEYTYTTGEVAVVFSAVEVFVEIEFTEACVC